MHHAAPTKQRPQARPVSELAKLIRNDIRSAQRQGAIAEGVKISVRAYAEKSVQVSLIDMPDDVPFFTIHNPVVSYAYGTEFKWSQEVEGVLKKVSNICHAHDDSYPSSPRFNTDCQRCSKHVEVSVGYELRNSDRLKTERSIAQTLLVSCATATDDDYRRLLRTERPRKPSRRI